MLMMNRVPAAVVMSLSCVLLHPQPARAVSEVLQVPGLGQVWLYAPLQSDPTEVVLFVSGDGGWNLGVIPMAETLRDHGALVVGIDIRGFMKTLEASKACAYPAGVLEELSRTVQLHRKVREYKAPILVGYSSGATLVYAALAGAPSETFAGAISLGFCPDVEISRPLCEQHGLVATRRTKGIGFDLAPNPHMTDPWMVLQGEDDQVCAAATTQAFVTKVPGARLFSLPKVGHGFAVPRNWEPQYLNAYKAISSRHESAASPAPQADIRDLALQEVPVAPSARTDTMAVILTGDGGWADLDKSIADGMAARGIPSVGWSSLRYYWTPRTPEGAAADLTRIATYYMSEWNVKRIILVGYSFGADVLPFLVNRLPAQLTARVRSVALLGPSDTAEFEFHLSDWVRRGRSSEFHTVAEVQRLRLPVVCVRGADETDSACRNMAGPHITLRQVGQGHHFSGDYAQLVDVILNTYR